jgi:protease stability complex PrcB-like protein
MNFSSSRNLSPRAFSPAFVAHLLARKSLPNATILRRASVKIATFLSFLLPLAVLSIAPAGAAERVPFVTIDQGFRSGVRERKFLVIKNETEWKTLWHTHAQPNVPAKGLPRVDFDKEMVVTVFLGEKPTGGYKVEVTAIEEDRGKSQLRIVLRESKPPAGSIAIQALTQPYHIVRVKKSDLTTTFVTEP